MDVALSARQKLTMAQAEPHPQPAATAAANSLVGLTILQVVPALDAGGVERTAVDVAKGVAGAGGRSLVVSAGGRLEAELETAGVVIRRLPLESRSPTTVLASARALRRLVVNERVDLVHARSRLPAWPAMWAARGAGSAFVTTYAGIYNARSGLKRAYNRIMARGDVVIANSAFTRDHVLAEHGVEPERVVAIPRGLDLARFDPASVSDERVAQARSRLGRDPSDHRLWMLLAGRLTRWKGQALAVDALAKAVAQGAGAVLVLAGDEQGRTAYREELRQQADRLGVGDRVRIVGHLDDMPAAYLACDVALAPSLDPEAFGRTAAEPQALGRPVLAADHGGARETVRSGITGLLVAPGDIDAWAQAIVTAATWSGPQREAMGRAGRDWVRARFSVEAMTNATLAIYMSLLANRPLR